MGYCSSYSEILRFEEKAVAPDVLGGQAAIGDTVLLFAADNVGALDRKGTFHGVGMIAAATPSKQVCYTIARKNCVFSKSSMTPKFQLKTIVSQSMHAVA